MLRPFNDVDFHAFVDGQVSPDRRSAIAAYLATAPDDAARVDLWRKQSANIKASYAAPANEPVPLWLTVGQIAAGRAGREPIRRQDPKQALRAGLGTRAAVPPLHASWIMAAIAFAAGVLVTGAVDRAPHWAGWMQTSEGTAGRGFHQRAWEAHETFGLDPDRPVDVTDATPGHVQAWLDSRVPFRVKIPDLHADGWTLLGGRIAPNDAGPGALLVYRNGAGDRLSLFAGRFAQDGADAAAGSSDERSVFSWTEGSVGYALMSSRGKEWLDRHAPVLKQATFASGNSPFSD